MPATHPDQRQKSAFAFDSGESCSVLLEDIMVLLERQLLADQNHHVRETFQAEE